MVLPGFMSLILSIESAMVVALTLGTQATMVGHMEASVRATGDRRIALPLPTTPLRQSRIIFSDWEVLSPFSILKAPPAISTALFT